MRLLAPLLVVLASSCGGLTTKLCGAPGQPCCSMNACDVGALCGAGQLCEACGGEGQRCCGGDACNEPLSCVSGACVQGITCAVQCTLGASRCANGGVETCQAAGLCPAWQQTVVACPPGSDCLAATADTADCVERCPGACTVNTQICTVNGLEACVESGACPLLAAQPDDLDVPACLTGAVVNTDLAWESPTPMGATIRDIAGDGTSSYWLLDELGNIVQYAQGAWLYEVRAAPGKQLVAMASCGLGARLYAVGRNGTVMRRATGGWTEENVGAPVDLLAVACTSAVVYAVSDDGTLYVRENAVWTGYPLGFSASFTGVTHLFSQGELYVSASNGRVVRCDVSRLPPTCALEVTPTTQDLTAIWADTFSNTVFAVGTGGTLLQKGATWQAITVPGTTTGEAFTHVTGYYDPVLGATWSVVVSSLGRVIVRKNAEFVSTVQLSGEVLERAWVPRLDTLVVTGQRGGMWYRGGLESASPFAARGGRKPISADLFAVTSVGQGRLFAVGAKGARYRRQNGAWLVDELGVSTSAGLNGVAARSLGEVYAVGDDGTVLVRRWGTWGREAVGLTTEPLRAIVLDATRAWALGSSALFEKNFATGQWRRIPLPESAPFLLAMAIRKDVQGRALELALVGAECTVVSYLPTVGQFSQLQGNAGCVATHRLQAAAFLSSGELVVASDAEGIFRRVSGALQSEHVPGFDTSEFYGLVPDGASMWAVGGSGAIYRRVTTTWADATPSLTAGAFIAGVKDDEGLFFVGHGGAVLRRQ